MTDQLRRALRDIPNPEHDKRNRYGWKSIAKIPEGHVFTLNPSVMETGADGLPTGRHPAWIQACGASTSIDRETERAILDASEPYAPATWEDVEKEYGVDHGWLAREVLEALLKAGRVTIAELRDCARIAHE